MTIASADRLGIYDVVYRHFKQGVLLCGGLQRVIEIQHVLDPRSNALASQLGLIQRGQMLSQYSHLLFGVRDPAGQNAGALHEHVICVDALLKQVE